jgi:hypothetical protein
VEEDLDDYSEPSRAQVYRGLHFNHLSRVVASSSLFRSLERPLENEDVL